MLDNAKLDPQRPPLLPKPAPRARGRALDRARAFLQIRRIRLTDLARRLWQRMRRRPALSGVLAAAVVIVAGLGTAVALDALPDIDLNLNPFAPKTVMDA